MHTRHNEDVYKMVFSDVATAISAEIPAHCQMNKVPKHWAQKETYVQMIPNRDHNNPDYDIAPRLGAFEISTVWDNEDILFFSKKMSNCWPNPKCVAARLKEFAADTKVMSGRELKIKYQTTNQFRRTARSSFRTTRTTNYKPPKLTLK